jgi:hypothetical protein
MAVTSSDSMASLHDMIEKKCSIIKVSSYSVRPQPVFDHAMVNTSIIFKKKDGIPCRKILSTKMYRKNNLLNLNQIINSLQFIDVKDLKLNGRYPKISMEIEKNILIKVLDCDTKFKDLMKDGGVPIYYRTTGGRYYKIITNYSTGSTKEKKIYFEKKISNLVGAILSSNLFFWFYQIMSNNLDLKTYEIASFGLPSKMINNDKISELESIYSIYLKDIEKNVKIRQTKKYANIDSFREYKISKSKHIIDKIDLAIQDSYGLTDEEINFIINYDLKFRTDDED